MRHVVTVNVLTTRYDVIKCALQREVFTRKSSALQ